MAAELQTSETTTARPFKKRKPPPHRKGKNPNKKPKPREAKAKKPTMQMQKLFKRRANEYHSSDEEESDAEPAADPNATVPLDQDDDLAASSEGEGPDPGARDEDGGSDDSEGDGAEVLQGITRFAEGCRAFKLAFLKIIKKKLSNDPLGPILSAHKNLVIEKLAEEVATKGKSETKKEKHLAQEKGHVKPATYLDAKEKLLISIATKGVVKLFNAVNNAQNSQKGLDPSTSKDAKILAKRRKQTFLSELKKSTEKAIDSPSSFNGSKVLRSTNGEKDDEPGWAPLRDSYMLTSSPLRDSYMLTSSKLKNWDKMPDSALDDHDRVPLDSSSDEE